MKSRPFAAESDLRLMQEVLVASWRVEKPLVRHHVGDLAWGRHQHVGREHEWRIRLWEIAGETVGWAWLTLPGHGELAARPEHRPAVLPSMLEWLESEAREAGAERLTTSALDRDGRTLEALRARGFGEDGAPFNSMVRPLDGELPVPALPPGFRVRHVAGEADLTRRVAVHRAAWSVQRPSRLTEESYRKAMAAWPYRRELDWVVEAPDGRFAASCLIWLDEENGVGELEPVGTDPACRRRGFAFAACAAALEALRELGADTAVVHSIDVDGMPSAPALYRKLGFETRGLHLVVSLPL